MMSRRFEMETLEARQLFAGVTVLATGRLGGTNGWMQSMANEITAKLGGASQVPQYRLTVDTAPNSGNLVASISHVSGTATPQTSSSGEIIVLVDYYNISANASYPSTYIGQVIADYMMSTPVDGVLLASLPVHGVGVSRGTALMDGMAKELGKSGIWVDQESYLDPNPIGAQGDPTSTVFDNVAFVDNYWRNDGSASQANDGNPVSGAYNLNVYWIDANSAGYGTPHLAPSGYYEGTIDLNATHGGEGPIYSNWYGNTPTMPARNATGFIYSQIIGAARPASGVWAASGGTGTRTAAGQSGSQWGNVSDLAVTSGTTFASGSTLQASYIRQDRDSGDTITFYLDADRNPYNGAFAATLGNQSAAEADTATQGTATLSTAGVAAGNYWLVAKITDSAGHTRYAYNSVNAPLTVQGSSQGPGQGTGGALSGTSAAPAASYNLTTLGTSDWAHWGTGQQYGAFDHKASGGNQISNVTTVGAGGNFGAYIDNSRKVTWTDGTPHSSNTGDNAYLWSNGSLNTGYTFTVPADTTTRTLTVYAGGINTTSSLTAHLSDGSASDVVMTAGASGLYTKIYTITYNAASAGKTLTITLLKTGNLNGQTNGSADLIAAYLNGGGTVVTLPAAPGGVTATPGDKTVSLAWSAVNGASTYNVYRSTSAGGEGSTPFKTGLTGTTFSDTGLTNGTKYYYQVTAVSGAGEGGKSQEASATPQSALPAAPGSVQATPGDKTVSLTWSAVSGASTYNLYRSTSAGGEGSTPFKTGLTGTTFGDTGLTNGTKYYYQVTAVSSAGEGGKSQEASATPQSASSGGTLTGTSAAAAASYNLTTLGTSDWAHWGTGQQYNGFDHKATGGSKISNLTTVGAGGNFGAYIDNSRKVTWTDGTPHSINNGDNAYLWSNGALNTGYSFTVTADTTTRTLTVYAGGINTTSSLTAHLSDGSAADVVLTAGSAGLYTKVYTITYKAASAGQKLTLTLLKTGNLNGQTNGSADLIAAYLN